MGALTDAKAYATVAVSDMQRATAFYRDTLGLSVVQAIPGIVTTFECGGTRVEVYQSQFAGTNQATGITFEVADLDGAMAALRQQGVVFEEYDQPEFKTIDGVAETEDVRSSWLKDPDGNVLSLIEFSRRG